MQTIRDGWDGKHPELDAALLFNRKLWSIFVTSATSPENPLPADIRQNVANIGLFVFKQTLAILADPKPENLGSLININREMAAGLLARLSTPHNAKRPRPCRGLFLLGPGNPSSNQPVTGDRKANRLSCASRAVVDSDADRLVCSDRICAPIWVVSTPSIDCSIVVNVFDVCACWFFLAPIAFCALARLASISLMFCTPLGTASAM